MNVLPPIALGLAVALAGAAARPCAARGQEGRLSIGRIRLEELVGRAGARASDYFALFKDLTAEETKTVEEVRASGEVSRRRQIVSDLIVYRSQLDGGSVAEYRDVRAVDGQAVGGRERRVLALFERQGRAGSVRDELRRINQEGSRYDLDRTVSGLTIGQALPLQPSARAFFDFAIEGEEQTAGRRAIVVAYEQAAPNPRFGFDLDLPDELEREPPRYRGRLWLDAETAHVLREVREVTARAAGAPAPVVVQRTEFEYAPSRFDVPLPRRIVFGTYLRFERGAGPVASSLDFRITFAYGPFRRFTTESDEGQIAAAAPEPPAPKPAAPEPVAPRPATPAPPAPEPVATAEDLGPEFGPDAPLGPPEPAPKPSPKPAPERTAAPSPKPVPERTAAPSPARAATRSVPRVSAPAPVVVPLGPLPAFLRAPEQPVVSVAAPPPPPEPGRRPLRLPPS